jgi:hypothetical protein
VPIELELGAYTPNSINSSAVIRRSCFAGNSRLFNG